MFEPVPPPPPPGRRRPLSGLLTATSQLFGSSAGTPRPVHVGPAPTSVQMLLFIFAVAVGIGTACYVEFEDFQRHHPAGSTEVTPQ